MAASPVLVTPRLRLEPFSEARITPQYVGWLNDPAIVRFSERRHNRHTAATALAYLETFSNTPNHFWAIVSVDHKLGHIGNITAHVDPQNQLADIGILIGERGAWGMGFGTEAWCAVISFLFGEVGVRKVTAGTVATNTGMLHIMKRAGMHEDGRRFRHYLVDGVEVDVVHMAKFKDEPC
jgi:RimJ/RimL family protein N-acetyltransferase